MLKNGMKKWKNGSYILTRKYDDYSQALEKKFELNFDFADEEKGKTSFSYYSKNKVLQFH